MTNKCEYCQKDFESARASKFCSYECTYHHANENRKAQLCTDRESRKEHVESIIREFGSHIALIPGTDKYYATDDGRIFSSHRWVWKEKAQYSNRGYMYAPLGGAPKKVHHLVLLAFGYERPDGAQVRHLNGIRNDNRLSNIVWGTCKENAEDKVRHGTDPSGERSGVAKLNNATVESVIKRAINGESIYKLASEYGVSAASVCRWKNGKIRAASLQRCKENL